MMAGKLFGQALSIVALCTPFFGAQAARGAEPSAAEIIANLNRAYQALRGYQAETEVAEYRAGKVREKKRFLYSFRKPHDIRIDMRDPHRGTSLLCCDAEGKVLVRLAGLGSLLRPRLAQDNRLLASASGQRIDQTDLGFLIGKVGHSLTDQRRGELKITEEDGRVVAEIVAADHFLNGVVTRYRFLIDKGSWLPVGVVELTPEGMLKRVVSLSQLHAVADFPLHFFDMDGKGEGEGEGGR